MVELVSKALLRDAVNGSGSRWHRIYSTANLKSTGEYRISIPWHSGYRNSQFSDVMEAHWDDCHDRRDVLIHNLEEKWPQLRGHVRSTYHIGICIYLSLRVDNVVLTR